MELWDDRNEINNLGMCTNDLEQQIKILLLDSSSSTKSLSRNNSDDTNARICQNNKMSRWKNKKTLVIHHQN